MGKNVWSNWFIANLTNEGHISCSRIIRKRIQIARENEKPSYLPHPCCRAMSTEGMNQKSDTQLVRGNHWISCISSFT